MKIIKSIITIIILLTTLPLYSADMMRIAIMDFQEKDISKNEAVKISELIRNEMVNIGRFTVIERAQIGSILKEQGYQQTGCTDESCAVEIGKLLSARKILVGTIMKMGEQIIIIGRIVDVEVGTSDFSSNATARNAGQLHSTVKSFVNELAIKIEGEVAQQRYVYRNMAFTFTGVTLLSFGGGIYSNMKVTKLSEDHDSLLIDYKNTTNPAEAEKLHEKIVTKKEDADSFAMYRNISYGVSVASSLAMVWFFYKYLTFEADPAKRADNSGLEIMPYCYTNVYALKGNNTRSEFSLNGGVLIRF